jgi:hypothetical protein
VPVDVSTTCRIALADIQDGVRQIHALVDASAGTIVLSIEGEPQRRDDAASTPVPPVVAPLSTSTAAPDMVLTLGGATGNPLGFALSHVHVVAAPVGALDPSLRRSVHGGSRLQPGDPLTLARCDDGFRPSGMRSENMVASVDGDVIQLIRPVSGSFRCGQTLAFRDESFFFQTSIKRRDDLLNHLYRASIDYRVSALIEDERALPSAPLVESSMVDVNPQGAVAGRNGTPGVAVVITDRGIPAPPQKVGV